MNVSNASDKRNEDVQVLLDIAMRCASEEAAARRLVSIDMLSGAAFLTVDERCRELVRLGRRSRLALGQYLSFVSARARPHGPGFGS